MIKRFVLITFLLILLLFFTNNSIVGISVESDEKNVRVLIVDQNGYSKYRSIQKAINDAADGSIIYVNEGFYNEIIEIEKSISLIGKGRDVTFINSISEENKYAIRLGAPFITIKGFSITNGAPGLYASGIRITNSNSKIIECNFYDNPIGISIWSSNNLVEDCIFNGCTDEGIVLLGCEYSNCNNNFIINSVFYNNADGIELQHSSDNIIINCEIFNNTHSGIDAIVSSNDRNIIKNCKIYNNLVHGIYLSSSVDNIIIDCEIFNNFNGNVVNSEDSENNQLLKRDLFEKNYRSDLFKIAFKKISELMVYNNFIFKDNLSFLGKYKF